MELVDEGEIAKTHSCITFYRVRCGYEKEIRASLAAGSESGRYYKCFGHYDIVEFCSSALPFRSNFNTSPNILQSVSLCAIHWANPATSKPVPEWLTDAPLVMLVLFKLHPSLISKYGVRGEVQVLDYLARHLEDSHPNVMTSLGHSEVVLLLKGNDLSTMLRSISQVRDRATFGDVFKGSAELPVGDASLLPVFANSTSFPLISYELVLDQNDFSQVLSLIHI